MSKRKDDKPKSTPVFLQKIYKILESAPADIATWADSGDTFVVKIPSKFAKEILPHYFKTDNFSSFVRQLNFYGFRKVSYEDSNARRNRDRKSWEFKHPKFLRGRPDLLKDIRRKTYSETNQTSKHDIEDLKQEVKQLKTSLAEMRETMNTMSLTLMRALGGHGNPFPGAVLASSRQGHAADGARGGNNADDADDPDHEPDDVSDAPLQTAKRRRTPRTRADAAQQQRQRQKGATDSSSATPTVTKSEQVSPTAAAAAASSSLSSATAKASGGQRAEYGGSSLVVSGGRAGKTSGGGRLVVDSAPTGFRHGNAFPSGGMGGADQTLAALQYATPRYSTPASVSSRGTRKRDRSEEMLAAMGVPRSGSLDAGDLTSFLPVAHHSDAASVSDDDLGSFLEGFLNEDSMAQALAHGGNIDSMWGGSSQDALMPHVRGVVPAPDPSLLGPSFDADTTGQALRPRSSRAAARGAAATARAAAAAEADFPDM